MANSSYINIENMRSYVSLENLETALEERKLSGFKYMIVRNLSGRYTAIFPLGWNPEAQPVWFAQNGFLVL